MDTEASILSWYQFFIMLMGNASGAHLDFVKKLKGFGHNQVDTFEGSDYVLVFCPVVSRPGTDISEALADVPGGKPIILVVMYPTFRKDYAVPYIRDEVDNPNVRLTVSCLFDKGHLLKCDTNDFAWFEVQKFLGGSDQKMSLFQAIRNCSWMKLVFLVATVRRFWMFISSPIICTKKLIIYVHKIMIKVFKRVQRFFQAM